MVENCHGLTELSIPASVKKVARTSLSGCRSLVKIYISPKQIELLPASARYTAVLTYMEEYAGDPLKGAGEAEGEDAEVIGNYVRERQKSFLDLAINRRSAGAVRYMTENKLLSDDALKEYLSRSAATGRTEITALLLESVKDIREPALSEDPFA